MRHRVGSDSSAPVCSGTHAGRECNIEALARAVCTKMVAGDDTGEEKFAAEVEMYWRIVARSWKP